MPTPKVRTLINVVPYEDNVHYKRVTYAQVKKACGKKACLVCKGTQPAHGPYWQLVEWDEATGRKRTRYIGKELPPEAEEALTIRRFLTDANFRSLIHSTDTLTTELERRRKEVAHLNQKVARLEADLADARTRARDSRPLPPRAPNLEGATRMYRKLAAKYHPDHNPVGAETMKDINMLWQEFKGR